MEVFDKTMLNRKEESLKIKYCRYGIFNGQFG